MVIDTSEAVVITCQSGQSEFPLLRFDYKKLRARKTSPSVLAYVYRDRNEVKKKTLMSKTFQIMLYDHRPILQLSGSILHGQNSAQHLKLDG